LPLFLPQLFRKAPPRGLSKWAPTPILTFTLSPPAQQKPSSTLIKQSNLSNFIQAGCKYHFQLHTTSRTNLEVHHQKKAKQNLTSPFQKLPLRPTRLVRPRRKENPLPIHRSKPLRQTHIPPNPQPPRPRPNARVRRQTTLRKHRNLRIPRRRLPRPRPAPTALRPI
jgi:hypothetical protein